MPRSFFIGTSLEEGSAILEEIVYEFCGFSTRICLVEMEGNYSVVGSAPSLFSPSCLFSNTCNTQISRCTYVAGETKHNIDKLVDDLKCVMRLEASQEECPNVVQILDSVVNVSKTSIGGTTGWNCCNLVLHCAKLLSTNNSCDFRDH